MTPFPFTDIPGRTIGLFGELDQDKCLVAADAILRIRSSGSREAVHLYVGCQGAEFDDVFMLLDCLMLVGNRLNTYLVRNSDLHGAMLLAVGKRRHALPNSRLIFSSPSATQSIGFSRLTGEDPMRDRVNQFLIQRLGMFAAEEFLASRNGIDARQALKIGIVHKIIEPQAKSVKEKAMGKGRSR